MKTCVTLFSAAALLGAAGSAHAVAITTGDVTATLGPNFLIDEAAGGGSDVQYTEGTTGLSRKDFSTGAQGNVAGDQPLNVGAGGSLITITGVGWAGPNFAGTSATSISLNIRYLGADGVGGGGDDVLIGTVTDNFIFSGAGEYVWQFDTPISAVIDGANSFFRYEFNVQNAGGTFRVKSAAPFGVKLSAAGTSTAVSGAMPGDTDNDGDVDDSDLGTSFANYTGPVGDVGKTAAQGDTDADGDVDDSDLGNSFANYTGPLSPTAVPEPTSLALLGLGGLLAIRRRRA